VSTNGEGIRAPAATEQGRRPLDVLREREAWLELALEVGKMGIWSWEVATNQLRWSATLSRLYGLPEGTAPSSFEAYLGYVHPDDRAQFERAARSSLVEGDFNSEHRTMTACGKVTWVRAKAKVFRDERGAPVSMMGTCIDVTEQKQVENKLLFAERMISVGRLAAGVTHELNTPLGYIGSNVTLMRMQLERARAGASLDLSGLRTALDAISEGAERMRVIMSDLGAFSQQEGRAPGTVDVNRLIQASVHIVSNELRDHATVVYDFADEVPPVVANESKLGQVFINLLLNAAHAIAEAGRERGEIQIGTCVDGAGRAVVTVRDNGAGIAPSTLARIFEPFFTTKEIGKGTGLGLAVCESIVTSIGGRIEVESELGRGSSFRVILPAAPTSASKVAHAVRSSDAGGRVLVIDDSANFRTSLKQLLDVSGFDVAVADSGASALTQILRSPTPDVILCDLMMPGMTGMEFHDALTRERPDLARRIVFLTGGVFTPDAGRFLDRVDNLRIEKPFDLPELLAIIERARALD
jgi:PAS domain S-box-containing protein